MTRRDATRDWLERLHAAAATPAAPDSADTIRAALKLRNGPVVDKAARIVGEHQLAGFEADLVAAWAPLFVQPVKRDPGCGAKLAVATALDRLDHLHPTGLEQHRRHAHRVAPRHRRGVTGLHDDEAGGRVGVTRRHQQVHVPEHPAPRFVEHELTQPLIGVDPPGLLPEGIAGRRGDHARSVCGM